LQLTDLLFLVPEKIIALPWALSGYGINFYPREVQPRPSAEPREYREVGELGRGSSLLLLQFVRDPFDVVRKLGCVVSTAYVSVPMSWLCGIRSNCFGLGRRPYVSYPGSVCWRVHLSIRSITFYFLHLIMSLALCPGY